MASSNRKWLFKPLTKRQKLGLHPTIGTKDDYYLSQNNTQFAATSSNRKWLFIEREFRIKDGLKLGYNPAFTIPRGAKNITIEERTPSRNYLGNFLYLCHQVGHIYLIFYNNAPIY